MIIDIHAHTSNRKLSGLHTNSATIADLEALAYKFGIDKTVLMATYFPFKGSGVHNMSLLTRIAGRQEFLIFGSLDAMGDLEIGIEDLRRLARFHIISGIKIYPGYQNFDPSSEEIYPIYEIAQRYDLPVAIHTGELHHCCPKDQRDVSVNKCGHKCWIDQLGHLAHPNTIAPAVRKFPEVNFILCHMSNPFFEDLRQLMGECDNVYTDISGQFISGSPESTPEYKKLIVSEVKKFLELENGVDRMMFGTDFPIQSHEDSIEIVRSLGLPQEEQEKIFYTNAAGLLGLDS